MYRKYTCGACGSHDPTRYLRCSHAGCPDGRDIKRAREEDLKEAIRLLSKWHDVAKHFLPGQDINKTGSIQSGVSYQYLQEVADFFKRLEGCK